MKRLIIVLLVIGLSDDIYSQDREPEEYKYVIYPLNIPYLFFGRYQASFQIKVSKKDHLLTGLHYNRQLDYDRGNGAGFEFQYRINANRDPNVRFRTHNYWGFYYEMDWLNFSYPGDPSGITYTNRRTNIGILMGYTFDTNSRLLIDIFFGGGLAFNKSGDAYYSYNETYPFVKVGFQLGIGL